MKNSLENINDEELPLEPKQKPQPQTQQYKQNKHLQVTVLIILITTFAFFNRDEVIEQSNLLDLGHVPNKFNFTNEREYFYFRLYLWGDHERVKQAEFMRSKTSYPQIDKIQEKSICFPIVEEDTGSLAKFLHSLFKQKYSNFFIKLLSSDQNILQFLPQEYHHKIQIISSFRESVCQDLDLVFLATIKGEFIGSLALKTINIIFENTDIQLAFYPVLGYSQQQGTPVARANEHNFNDLTKKLNIEMGEHSYILRETDFVQIMKQTSEIRNNCKISLERLVYQIAQQGLKQQNKKSLGRYLWYSESSRNQEEMLCIRDQWVNGGGQKNVFQETFEKYQNLEAKKQIHTQEDEAVQLLEELSQVPNKLSIWHQQIHEDHPDKPTNRTYFAFRQFLDQDNQTIQKAEYYYLDLTYNISKYQKQLPICVVSCGRNLIQDRQYKKYIDFLARQNYTNFKAFYVDDVSTDETLTKMEEYVFHEHPQLKRKFKIMPNAERQETVGSREIGFSQCGVDDIVIDADADDELIGTQVLQFYNAIYQQNPSTWLFYTKAIKIDNSRNIIRSISAEIPKIQFEQHTISYNSFVISHLRSFICRAYHKILKEDLIDPRTGKFFERLGDLVIYNYIAEMAGPSRVLFIDQPVYYYKTRTSRAMIKSKKETGFIARNLDPYEQIDSFQETPRKTLANISVEQKRILTKQALARFSKQQKQIAKRYKIPMWQEELEKVITEIMVNNTKKYYVANIRSKETAALAEFLKENKLTKQVYELEKYYFNIKNFTKKFKFEIPIILFVQVRNVEENLEYFIDSMILLDYINFRILFLCQKETDRSFIKDTFTVAYPVFLQKALFFQNIETIDFWQILQQIVAEETVLVKMSMNHQIVGTQGFKLLNAAFEISQQLRFLYFPILRILNETHREIVIPHLNQLKKQPLLEILQSQSIYLSAMRISPDYQCPEINQTNLMVSPYIFAIIEHKIANKTDKNHGGTYAEQKIKEIQIQIERTIKGKNRYGDLRLKEEMIEQMLVSPKYRKQSAQLEQAYYNDTYSLHKYDQTQFCLIATASIHEHNQLFSNFFLSLSKQQYTNFKIAIGLINSQKISKKNILNSVQLQFPNLFPKIQSLHLFPPLQAKQLIQVKGELIQAACTENSWIVDLDANDQFIGVLSLEIINVFIHENPHLWFIITNGFYGDGDFQAAASPSTASSPYSLFYSDNIKVYRSLVFWHAFREIDQQMKLQSELYLLMMQFCGERVSLLNEFLWLDTKTDQYSSLDQSQKFWLLLKMQNPFSPLQNLYSQKHECSASSSSKIFKDQFYPESVFFKKRLTNITKILHQQQSDKERQLDEKLSHMMSPLDASSKNKNIMFLYYRLNRLTDRRKDSIEYWYLQKEYKMSVAEEKWTCIVSAGSEVPSQRYLSMLSRLNYTNYYVIVGRNKFTDQSMSILQNYLKQQHPQTNIRLLKNKFNTLLANKNHLIRTYCGSSDIVLDLNEWQFISGSNLLNLLNTIYNNDKIWIAYGNYFTINEDSFPQEGHQQQVHSFMLKYREFRRKEILLGLKSFRKQFFIKIDFHEQENLQNTSDVCVYSSLIELAGLENSYFIPEPILYLDKNIIGQRYLKDGSQCMKMSSYQKLEGLSDKAQRVKEYEVKEEWKQQVRQTIESMENRIASNKQQEEQKQKEEM